jgi:hypothetical protein
MLYLLRGIIVLASLTLSIETAFSAVLSLGDYDKFHDLMLKMQPIGDRLALVLIRQETSAERHAAMHAELALTAADGTPVGVWAAERERD